MDNVPSNATAKTYKTAVTHKLTEEIRWNHKRYVTQKNREGERIHKTVDMKGCAVAQWHRVCLSQTRPWLPSPAKIKKEGRGAGGGKRRTGLHLRILIITLTVNGVNAPS